MSEQFEVKQTVKLNDDELLAIENKEALFFHNSWLRSEFSLIQIAHDILIDLEEFGLIANYRQTDEFKMVKTLNKQANRLNSDNGKIRLNCPFTGKFDWLDVELLPEIYNDLMWKISEYITDAYGIDNYYCSYFEGYWGLWPNYDE